MRTDFGTWSPWGDCRTTAETNYPTTGLPDHPTTGLPDYPTTGLPDYPACAMSHAALPRSLGMVHAGSAQVLLVPMH